MLHQPSLISPSVISWNKEWIQEVTYMSLICMCTCVLLHVYTCQQCEHLPIGLVVSERHVIIYICYLYSRLHKSFHTIRCQRPIAFALKITQTLSKPTSSTQMLYLSKPLWLTGSIRCVSRRPLLCGSHVSEDIFTTLLLTGFWKLVVNELSRFSARRVAIH